MESDQLSVEANLNSSNQGESPEAIAPSGALDEPATEISLEQLPAQLSEQFNAITAEPLAIADASSEYSEYSEHMDTAETKSDLSLEENLPISETVATPDTLKQIAIIDQLKQEESALKAELDYLKTTKSKVLQEQIDDLQSGIIRLAQADVARLEYQKQELQAAIAILEKKKDRLAKEMTSTYAGASQDIAVRVQGFKDYLVGSLQDLVANAEKLNLIAPTVKAEVETVVVTEKKVTKEAEPILLSEQTFAEYKQRIDQLLDRYRTLPDYYGPAWKLRRTFEQVHADRVSNWFFEQSGRGAIRTMGTRLQNILVTSAAISVLKAVYGEKLRILVLATSPERLGEWRRGFQDCLGLTREHFGSDKGIALFEDPEPLAVKGDRLVKEGLRPLVIIDESEEMIAVDLLRFPLLIAFGGIPDSRVANPSIYINREPNRDQNRDMGRDQNRDVSRENQNNSRSNNQNNRDYMRESPRENIRENIRDNPRDYGNRETRDTGYNNRDRNKPDSDWDW